MTSKCISVGLLLAAETFAMSLWFASAAVLPEMAREADLAPARHALMTSAVQAGFVVGALAVGRDEQADQQASVPYTPSDHDLHSDRVDAREKQARRSLRHRQTASTPAASFPYRPSPRRPPTCRCSLCRSEAQARCCSAPAPARRPAPAGPWRPCLARGLEALAQGPLLCAKSQTDSSTSGTLATTRQRRGHGPCRRLRNHPHWPA